MRKKHLLLSLIIGALSIGALASCGKKKNDDKKDTTTSENTLTGPFVDTRTSTQTSTSTSTSTQTSTSTSTETSTTTEVVDKNVVDENVFNSYFGSYDEALSKLNIKFSYIDSGNGETYRGTIEIANNTALDTYKEDSTDDIAKTYYKYIDYDYEEDTLKDIESSYYDGSWDDPIEYSASYERQAKYLYLPIVDFADFVYNEETKSYEAEEIEISYGKYKDLSIKFEEDKLLSFSYDFLQSGNLDKIDVEVLQIGGVEIANPIYNLTTNNIFNDYFNMTKEELENLNITLNYMTGMYTGTIEVNNGLRIDTYKRSFDQKEILEAYYIDEVSPESVKFHYYVYSDGEWSERYDFTYSLDTYLLDIMYLPKIDFDDLTYNPETKSYEAASVTISHSPSDITITDVSIKFEDFVLASYKYSSGSSTFTIIVSNVGTTEIEDPRKDII